MINTDVGKVLNRIALFFYFLIALFWYKKKNAKRQYLGAKPFLNRTILVL